MAQGFSVKRRVEFSETDLAGIVHFSNFFRYMEFAEHALLRSMGLSVHNQALDGQVISWPRVHCSCDYRRPLRFEDEIDIGITLVELGGRSATYAFSIRKMGDTEDAATGKIVVACVSRNAEGGMKSVPIPETFRRRIVDALGEPKTP